MVIRLKTTEFSMNLNTMANFAYTNNPVEFLPEGTKDTAPVGVRLRKNIIEALDKMAVHLNMSRAQLGAFMIEDALNTLCQKILIDEANENPRDIVELNQQDLYDRTFDKLEEGGVE